MSGPVDVRDVRPEAHLQDAWNIPVVAVSESRSTAVGALGVRRALPNRGRRTVGPWCFADHFGPVDVDEHRRAGIGPHPHMGLQTVTWLLEGELVHRDSLGSEELIRPGQLNLMTAGRGVAHAEEATKRFRGRLHGMQLWVAQPSATRDDQPAFEQHRDLPRIELSECDATLLVGEAAGVTAPTRRDTEQVGMDLVLRGATTVPLRRSFEHAIVVTVGVVVVGGMAVSPGHLVYLGGGRDEVELRCEEESRALLLGGAPFSEKLLMWWNFVARTKKEVEVAYDDWAADSARFGRVRSSLPRVEGAPPIWRTPTS